MSPNQALHPTHESDAFMSPRRFALRRGLASALGATKLSTDSPFLRKLLVPFASSGYVVNRPGNPGGSFA